MFNHLQIYDWRERAAVGLADLALRMLAVPFGWGRARRPVVQLRRVLVLRLERIGDLLMAFDALATLRASLPAAQIDLVVGGWNEPLARAMAVADGIETINAPWLARGAAATPWIRMVRRAIDWRQARYDLAINLEPDIRSNFLLGLSGASCRVGFRTGGGGAALTDAAVYDPALHTSTNATALVRLALDAVAAREPASALATPVRTGRRGSSESPLTTAVGSRLQLPEHSRERARVLLAPAGESICVGIHASGGRPVKQWHASRFAEVAAALGLEYGATIVLTGTAQDKPLVREVRAAIPASVRVLDLCGQADVLDLSAVLERLDVFVTGDTGPMHLAAAVGTPVAAVFGPSDPARYAPLSETARIVRIDLPCSPCNRIRLPPERCRGHVPDCLEGISVNQVLAAVRNALSLSPRRVLRVIES